MLSFLLSCSFFFNDTATTEIYTLSLHDALPIYLLRAQARLPLLPRAGPRGRLHHPHRPGQDRQRRLRDRKSTRLNSSHLVISYAVFCLKKKILFDRLTLRVAVAVLLTLNVYTLP